MIKTRAIILASTLALVFPNAVLAHGNETENEHAASPSASVSARPEQIEVHNGHFELQGLVASVSSDKKSFAVLGKYIYIDPAVTGAYNQIGVLTSGATVKVEGVIVGGKYYARVLKVQHPGKPEFKEHLSSSSAEATESAEASESGTMQLSIHTATSSASPSASLNLNITGTVQDIINALQQAINFLKALL